MDLEEKILELTRQVGELNLIVASLITEVDHLKANISEDSVVTIGMNDYYQEYVHTALKKGDK